MRLQQAKYLGKLLVDVKELMKEQELLLIEVELYELHCLSKLNDPQKVLGKQLRNKLLPDDFAGVEKSVSVHRDSAGEVHEEPAVAVGEQFGLIERDPRFADVKIDPEALPEWEGQLELGFGELLHLALLVVVIQQEYRGPMHVLVVERLGAWQLRNDPTDLDELLSFPG
jgi:hypothetical protein